MPFEDFNGICSCGSVGPVSSAGTRLGERQILHRWLDRRTEWKGKKKETDAFMSDEKMFLLTHLSWWVERAAAAAAGGW